MPQRRSRRALVFYGASGNLIVYLYIQVSAHSYFSGPGHLAHGACAQAAYLGQTGQLLWIILQGNPDVNPYQKKDAITRCLRRDERPDRRH